MGGELVTDRRACNQHLSFAGTVRPLRSSQQLRSFVRDETAEIGRPAGLRVSMYAWGFRLDEGDWKLDAYNRSLQRMVESEGDDDYAHEAACRRASSAPRNGGRERTSLEEAIEREAHARAVERSRERADRRADRQQAMKNMSRHRAVAMHGGDQLAKSDSRWPHTPVRPAAAPRTAMGIIGGKFRETPSWAYDDTPTAVTFHCRASNETVTCGTAAGGEAWDAWEPYAGQEEEERLVLLAEHTLRIRARDAEEAGGRGLSGYIAAVDGYSAGVHADDLALVAEHKRCQALGLRLSAAECVVRLERSLLLDASPCCTEICTRSLPASMPSVCLSVCLSLSDPLFSL